MGRVGEVICRTWQTADKMKKLRGRLSEETVNMKCTFIVLKLKEKIHFDHLKLEAI